MKSKVIKVLKKQYKIRKVYGKKLESYNFYTLVHFLKLAESGEKLK